jgi:Spx/MgsR family transcriptional regulator
LSDHAIEHEFHDYRKHGADLDLLRSMAGQLGWEAMLNRRGTTWRKLPEAQKTQLDEDLALQLMRDNPALIKRPILAWQDSMHMGFSAEQYREIFS